MYSINFSSSSATLDLPPDEVISAGDGEQALTLAREHAPALILQDVLLPKMSGPDVLRILKKDLATAAIPVIC